MENHPIGYSDPTGHMRVNEGDESIPSCDTKLKKSDRCPKGTTDRRDLTEWLAAAANYTARHSEIQKIKTLNMSSAGESRISAATRFYNLVRDGAEFDVKDKILADVGLVVMLDGNWYEYSTTGNILYGFYGREAGFTAETLKRGAGYAQVMDVARWAFRADETEDFPGLGGPGRYFDDNTDSHAVDFGIYLYESFYADGSLTTGELRYAMENFQDSWGFAHEQDPGDCKPNKTGAYPADVFNQ